MYWYSFLLQLKFSSIGLIFIHMLFVLSEFFHQQYYSQEISWFCKIQEHFQDMENEFVIAG